MPSKDLDIGARFTLPSDSLKAVVYQRVLHCGDRIVMHGEMPYIVALNERALNVLYIPEGTEFFGRKNQHEHDEHRVDPSDLESPRRLQGDFPRLHELLRRADGAPPRSDGSEEVPRHNEEASQRQDRLDWQDEPRC